MDHDGDDLPRSQQQMQPQFPLKPSHFFLDSAPSPISTGTDNINDNTSSTASSSSNPQYYSPSNESYGFQEEYLSLTRSPLNLGSPGELFDDQQEQQQPDLIDTGPEHQQGQHLEQNILPAAMLISSSSPSSDTDAFLSPELRAQPAPTIRSTSASTSTATPFLPTGHYTIDNHIFTHHFHDSTETTGDVVTNMAIQQQSQEPEQEQQQRHYASPIYLPEAILNHATLPFLPIQGVNKNTNESTSKPVESRLVSEQSPIYIATPDVDSQAYNAIVFEKYREEASKSLKNSESSRKSRSRKNTTDTSPYTSPFLSPLTSPMFQPIPSPMMRPLSMAASAIDLNSTTSGPSHSRSLPPKSSPPLKPILRDGNEVIFTDAKQLEKSNYRTILEGSGSLIGITDDSEAAIGVGHRRLINKNAEQRRRDRMKNEYEQLRTILNRHDKSISKIQLIQIACETITEQREYIAKLERQLTEL